MESISFDDDLELLLKRVETDKSFVEEKHWDLFDQLLGFLDNDSEKERSLAHEAMARVCSFFSTKEIVLKSMASLSFCFKKNCLSFLMKTLSSSLVAYKKVTTSRDALGHLRGRLIKREEDFGAEDMDEDEDDNDVEDEMEQVRFEASALVSLCEALCTTGLDCKKVVCFALEVMENHRWLSLEDRQALTVFVAQKYGQDKLLDGRFVHALYCLLKSGLGTALLPVHVLTAKSCLFKMHQCLVSAFQSFSEDAENERLKYRATTAAQIFLDMVARVQRPNNINEHDIQLWVSLLLRMVIEFCVRCEDQSFRSSCWRDGVEKLLKTFNAKEKVYCVSLLLSCPYGTVTGLLCSFVKDEMDEALREGGQRWRHLFQSCKNVLFVQLFKIPSNESQFLNSHRDAILAACNLLLFLTLRLKRMNAEEISYFRWITREYVSRLKHAIDRELKQLSLPIDLSEQNKMMKKMGQHELWTEKSLLESNEKKKTNLLLISSVINRIEEFEQEN